MRFLIFLSLTFSALAQPQPEYDVLIRGGKIVDGTAAPWFIGDVGVRQDTIVYVGPAHTANAKLVLEAEGLAVAPGFVDTHSHGRRGYFLNPAAENQIRQGVTTIIEGPDGSSPLPIGKFLQTVAATKSTVNFGTMAGHGSIRQQIIGMKDRKATPEELEKMKALASQAMLDGAFGISTGLFYLPGNFAPTEEVIALGQIVGALGGIHTSHMRNEADASIASVKETIRIGEQGHLPTQVTHHKIIGKTNWGQSVDTLRLVDEARARGVDVTIDQYPYTASSTGLAALFPQWAQESGPEAFRERANAPDQRAKQGPELDGDHGPRRRGEARERQQGSDALPRRQAR